MYGGTVFRRFVCPIVAAAALALTASPLPTSQAVQARGSVHIDFVRYDPAGSDTGTNRHLNKEIVIIRNSTGKARVLTGWVIKDPAGHRYKFPKTRLKPGRAVTLHTGKGANNPGDRFWDQGNYVWNNDGDKAILRKRNGARADVCKWGDGDGSTNC